MKEDFTLHEADAAILQQFRPASGELQPLPDTRRGDGPSGISAKHRAVSCPGLTCWLWISLRLTDRTERELHRNDCTSECFVTEKPLIQWRLPMRVTRKILIVFLSAWLALPVRAQAQQTSIVDQATLDQAVATHAQESDADREAVHRMLSRQQVREIGARVGIDVRRAESAVSVLNATELHQIADQARAVDDSLSGGQSKVTISTTTIIIGLLLLILIIVAVR